jgi:hypothetical protein
MPAMAAMEQVHERTGEQNNERQSLKEMGAMLGDQIIADDANQREKQDPEDPGRGRRLGGMMLLAMRGVMQSHLIAPWT